MPDTKITALTANTTPALTDITVMVDDPGGTPLSQKITLANLLSLAYPVGSIYISIVSTNPATLLGFGTWAAFAAGRTLVGLDSGDTDFDTPEETRGAKTVASAGSVAAPTISGSTASESSHTHSVTSNVAVADHANHTHSFTPAGTVSAIAASASGTVLGGTTLANSVADDTHTHPAPTFTGSGGTTGNESATQTHNVTNNAVTSGAGSSHSHGVGTLAASAPAFTGSATSVVQPSIVVYMWKRTA